MPCNLLSSRRRPLPLILPLPQLTKPMLRLFRRDIAMPIVLHVMLHKQVSLTGLAREQDVHVRNAWRHRRIVRGMNRQDRTRQLSRGRVISLQIIQRPWIGGITLDLVVYSIVVRRAGVDGIAIIK